MIILGIDPGIARTGFGLIDTTKPQPFIKCGCLTTGPTKPFPKRLTELTSDLKKIITAYQPHLAVVEQVFFGSNQKTAILVAQARGAILHLLNQHTIPIRELTPLQIKSRLVGHGRADKHQVQKIVAQQLDLDTIPQPDDAADALAAALSVTNTPTHA